MFMIVDENNTWEKKEMFVGFYYIHNRMWSVNAHKIYSHKDLLYTTDEKLDEIFFKSQDIHAILGPSVTKYLLIKTMLQVLICQIDKCLAEQSNYDNWSVLLYLRFQNR